MVTKKESEAILDECLSRKKEYLNLLGRLVKIETPPADSRAHQKLFGVLEKELSSVRYLSSHYPGINSGGQILAKPESLNGSCYQLMLGHIDTVWPKGTLDKMPFAHEGDVYKGPGIYDMKAGITMMIQALKIMNDLELSPRVTPVIFINSDEETGSRDSVYRIRNLARAMNRVYVLEPSLDPEGKLKTRRKGVGHFDVIIKGVSSHAGIEPEKGRSAIVELSFLIQKLNELNDPENGISVNVGKIGGGTNTNVVAGESSAAVDVRVLTKKDAERIRESILDIEPTTPGVELQITGGFKRPPLVRNQRNRTLWNEAVKISKRLGIGLSEGISGGGSDGSYTSLFTATLDGLGAVGDGAHSPTEKIFLDKTLERIALLIHLLMLPEQKTAE
ncbi:M20/M25/M40 family metallo-hydrolase [Rhodohalobacter mucosus]|uniref:Carboxypeptidase n=1 Tax=Rhodohalobacter mucosus TaxID=2079485 RepID=A0A316TXL3_9BACT|nr:M20/M25/M40 family metallo-hydrolase [Rhodohalobacter mucosus]PWN07412.1 carboxypeptidase [Rhodohalobacter mucosus]